MHGENLIKVGDLARRCGVSVRTLHFYEQAGLLEPSRQLSSGHRVYSSRDVVRLQQIVSLKQIGMSLGEIKEHLSQPQWSASKVLRLQIRRLRERIDREHRLCSRLEALAK